MHFKDFTFPHTWEKREVVISDSILFIPSWWDKYESYTFPGWGNEAVFANERPVKVEYCSGNGTWICQKAAENPLINWVAVERRFDRVRKIWARGKRMELSNLFIVYGEAYLATRLYFPKASVEEAYINFPDPWPKDKHAKHRLVTPEFVSAVKNAVCSDGTVTCATDDKMTSQTMISHFRKNFVSRFPEPYFVREMEGYGDSYFESLWRQKGKEIFYHRFSAS